MFALMFSGMSVIGALALAASVPDSPHRPGASSQADARVVSAAPTPAPRRPILVSPEVAVDRRVTFRFWAPRAQQVSVRGLFFQPQIAMTRDNRGVWSVTTGPIAPGLYEYHFGADELTVLDPANPEIEPSPTPENSILEVPGTPPLLTEFQDVPHGAVHVHHYRRKGAAGQARRLHVYTPPGYEVASRRERMPVLVLLHGAGGTDATWSAYGRLAFMLDNLLAQRRVEPMVVVMPNGHPAPSGPPSPDGRSDNTRAFAEELFADVLPLVERHYRVRREGAGRAIVGLSMGGRQALRVGLENPDRFSWVGAMGGSIPPEPSFAAKLVEASRSSRHKLRWLWIGCGRLDRGYERMDALASRLSAEGVRAVWYPSDGGHNWAEWRRYLAELSPQLFRPG
jgi:enterochelin esterase-like enzyme